jgi:pimeloyl-ACP methyl ester carboxylesterase
VKRVILPIALVLLVAAVPASGATSQQQVIFRTEDGLSLAGTLYLPGRPAPAVILLHMQTRSREDWQVLGQRLADAGIAALAIDLRGHGASDHAAPVEGASAVAGLQLDVKAARAFLGGRTDVIGSRLGFVGASIGANLAVIAAAGDPSVRTLALLSVGLDYRGLRTEAALNRYGARPALMVASQEDNYAMISMRRLAGQGTGTREQVVLDGAGHGTVMMSRQPDLVATLVDWFRRTLL